MVAWKWKIDCVGAWIRESHPLDVLRLEEPASLMHRQDGEIVLDVAADRTCILVAFVSDAGDRIDGEDVHRNLREDFAQLERHFRAGHRAATPAEHIDGRGRGIELRDRCN